MNILTIDTALNKSYIALLLNGNEIFKTIESDENGYHSGHVIKALRDMNFSFDKINYLGVNTGVGSFTGIRAGLSIIKIFSDRLNIKTVQLQTAEILSCVYNTKNIMLDARRGSAFYSNDGKNLEIISYESAAKILEKSDNSFICDNSLLNKLNCFSSRLISFEQNGADFPKIELELTKEKIKEGLTVEAAAIKPTYIQTPPIFV